MPKAEQSKGQRGTGLGPTADTSNFCDPPSAGAGRQDKERGGGGLLSVRSSPTPRPRLGPLQGSQGMHRNRQAENGFLQEERRGVGRERGRDAALAGMLSVFKAADRSGSYPGFLSLSVLNHLFFFPSVRMLIL